MKRFSSIVTLLSLSATALLAEVSYCYQYDAAGNRISREVVLNRLETSQTINKSWARIYPSVTKDFINVENISSDNLNGLNYIITNSMGVEVANGVISGSVSQIYMPQEQGIYFMTLINGVELVSFKIIKY